MLHWLKNIFKKQPKVIVILGPTSAGKTDLSIEIAKKYNGEIISADARQIYTELNLLSGKVTPEEMSGVPHHLLNISSVAETVSIAQYKQLADKAIADILSRGKLPIIVGGNGFYIDSLVYNISFPEVEPNPKLRAELEQLSTENLFERLKKQDPKRASNIDSKNPVRLTRAIEIAETLGKNPPPPTYTKPVFSTLFIGLDLPDDKLKDRIGKRIEKRLKAGMLDEVKSILQSGIPKERMYTLGLDAEYSTRLYLGEILEPEMIEKLSTETWQYVRRQRMWWKRNKTIHWFNPTKDSLEITSAVEKFLG